MSNNDNETSTEIAPKSDKCQLQAELSRLQTAASNFLNRYDTLQTTHDSYGLFTARNDLAHVLKCLATNSTLNTQQPSNKESINVK